MTQSDSATDPGEAAAAGRAGRAAAVDIAVFLACLATLHVTTLRITQRYGGPITASLMVVITTVLLRRRHIRWRDLGLRRPDRPMGLLIQVPVALVTWLTVSGVTATLVGHYLPTPDTSARFGDLAGNLPATLWWIGIAWLIGGFAEEMLFRGFLLNRLEALLALGARGSVIAALLQAILFGALHAYNRGLFGFIVLGAVGAVLGGFYLLFRRNLWPVILAHGLGNTLGFVARYVSPV